MDHVQWAVDSVSDGDGSLSGLSLDLLWPTKLVALGPRDAHGQHLFSPLFGPSKEWGPQGRRTVRGEG